METARNTNFKLISYQFTEFLFRDSKDDRKEMEVGFKPSGVFIEQEKKFELQLAFIAHKKEKKPLIRGAVTAIFEFDEAIKYAEIPDYFYPNSIAIIFPYIRSIISAFSVNAGFNEPIILPILNLSGLAEPLKERTVVITE